MAEHVGLLIGGLLLGVGSAAVAVFPTVLSPTADVPYLGLASTLAGVFLSGLVWTGMATGAALRGRLLDGLRNE